MTMTAEPHKVNLIDRLLCLIVILSMQLFTGADFFALFPYDHTFLVVKAASEVVTILALLRIGNGVVVRDLIDLSLYSLMLRSVILFAWFTPGALYDTLNVGPSMVLNNMLFLAGLVRLVWGRMQLGQFVPLNWPPIGLYGLYCSRLDEANDSGAVAYFRVTSLFIICAEIACVLLPVTAPIYQFLPGVIGIMLAFTYANHARQAVIDTERDLSDQEAIIERYEGIIANFANAVSTTEPRTPKLRVVKNDRDEA